MHDIWYEFKPQIVFVGGALCAGLAANAVMFTGGLILMAAGGIIWKMRRDYVPPSRYR